MKAESTAMANPLSANQRFELITQRIPSEDVYGADLIRTALELEGKTPKCLWGMSRPCASRGV